LITLVAFSGALWKARVKPRLLKAGKI